MSRLILNMHWMAVEHFESFLSEWLCILGRHCLLSLEKPLNAAFIHLAIVYAQFNPESTEKKILRVNMQS